jgi:hypothetical protein
MAEVLHDYGLVRSSEGAIYHVRACGSPMDESRWQGWLEFEPVNGGGETLRSSRETTQPNRTDLVYWATGLTAVYLEGSLNRTLNPLVRPTAPVVPPPAFDGPAPPAAQGPPPPNAVLNPFSVYRKGEALLRDQLRALSAWHLVNIILAHDLSEIPVENLNLMPAAELVELIVASVRLQMEEGASQSSR